jgi:SAM-dependent methyltransferase
MHDTAMKNGQLFFETYVSGREGLTIVDLGAGDVNGALRSVAPTAKNKFIGVDMDDCKGVDLVLKDPYDLPFEDSSIDVVVSSSCMEHAEFFWLSYLEMIRILKPSGLLYINSPSNGALHRHPMDCWRFYPDSGVAMSHWAQKNGYKTAVLESFTGKQLGDVWNDFVAVFVKDEAFAKDHPNRMIERDKKFTNALVYGDYENFINYAQYPEDQARFKGPKMELRRKINRNLNKLGAKAS